MDKLIKILKDINPDIDYENEKALIDDGFFDSLEIMSIVMDISENLHVEIDADDVTADNFNSVESMWKLISKYKEY